MTISVYIRGDAEEELQSLLRWLQDDPDVRQHALLSIIVAEPREGEMGGAAEAVKLVLDEGFQVANFAVALLSWRATRRSRPALTIERSGITVNVDDADPEMIDKILSALEKSDS